MKKKIVGILVSIMLVISFMVVFPINDVQSIVTTSDVDDGGDVKQLIQDFVSSSEEGITADDIVGFVNGNAQNQLTSGTGFGFGDEYVYNTASTPYNPVVALTSSKIVIAYSDYGNSQYGTAVVGTISGNTISYGSEYVFNAASTHWISVAKVTSSKIVITYRDMGNSDYGTAIVGTISGTAITYGSEYVFNAAYTMYTSAIEIAASKIIIAYSDVGHSRYGTAVVGIVSGTTITFGSEYVFHAASTSDFSTARLTSSKFVVAYSDYDNSAYGTAVIGTVTDFTITYGSEYVFNPATTYDISAASLSSTKFVVAYRDYSNSNYGTAVAGTVSDTTISYGLEYVYNTANSDAILIAALTSSKIVIAYRDYGYDHYAIAVCGNVSGTTISYGGKSVINNASFWSNTIAALTPSKIVIAYRDDGNSCYGTAIIGDENPTPNTPTTPEGPTNLGLGESGTYSTSATDPDEELVQYRFDWNASGAHEYSDWTDLGPSGHTDSLQNSWNSYGTYAVKAQTRDENGIMSGWSNSLTVIVENQPPEAPSISGETNGKAGTEYEYTFSATEPEGDDVSFYVEWGDDTSTGWTEFVESETPVKLKHTWEKKDTYIIRAKAKDIHGAESDWSYLEVSMPVNQPSNHPWLWWLLERSPLLKQLLWRFL